MILFLALAAGVAVLVAACGDDGGGEDGSQLVVITHDSFNLTKSLISEFEKENKTTVKIVPKGDAGAMLTSLILTKGNPEGDVSFGVDNTFLSRALEQGVFQKYQSPLLDKIPDDLKVDSTKFATPIDYGYVNFNYDIEGLKKAGAPVPQKLEDLTDGSYKGLVVVENPASSSTGLAFMIATVDYFGADKWLDWWKAMRKNDMKVVDGWETAYNVNFSLHGGGQPIVLSYATSPAYEQMAAKPARSDSPTANFIPPKGAFRQIEYAAVLKGTKRSKLAEKFIDFLLSKAVQEDVPGQMAVYPVNSDAAVPDAFTKFAKVDVPPANVSPNDIAKNRDSWIDQWTKAVVQ
ncbi:MAG: thiamine ABC transporter substrate-binding protein [Dehalococcoidia bacterium]|nr:thiamine ABC transporter substrate-binding protein [Dehalococcoidia bacterium]